MKVFNLIWKFGTGGIAKCFEIYSKLGECDASVDVLSVCIDPQCFNYDRRKLVELGVTCIKVKSPLDFSWHSALGETIKAYKPDVIFTHGFHGPMIYLVTKMLHHLHTPLVASYHGMYYSPTKKKKWIAPLINGATIFIYNHFCERVIAVSDYSKRELEARGVSPSKVRVVHNGIPDVPMRAKTAKSSSVIKIGVVSRLDPFKGIDVLIDAMSEVVAQSKSDVKLEIVGDGPMDVVLKEEIEKRQLENVVSLLGYRSDVADLMAEWDAFCLPSFFENHSIAILEAMRSGRPIVTTDVGGNPESVRNGKEALLVQPKDTKGLAKALSLIVNDAHLRESLGKNARLRYEKEFTENVMENKLVEALTLEPMND